MPVFFLSLPGLRSGASRLSGPRGSRWSACVWMSLHAFVSLPPCRLFIISASSFLSPPMFPCTFLRLLLAVAPVFPHLFPPRFPMPSSCRLLCFPASSPYLLPSRSSVPSYLSSPASSSRFSPLPPYLPCVFLLFAIPASPRIFLSPLSLAFSLPPLHPPPVSSPLRFPMPSGNSLLAMTRGGFLDRDSYCLVFLVRGLR